MPQTYAVRADLRPGWKRYKNRKKTLRRQFHAGKINWPQFHRLMREAAKVYASDPTGASEVSLAYFAAVRRGEEALRNGRIEPAWRDDERADYAWCHPDCIGATGRSCRCKCGGRNHGAWRRDPTVEERLPIMAAAMHSRGSLAPRPPDRVLAELIDDICARCGGLLWQPGDADTEADKDLARAFHALDCAHTPEQERAAAERWLTDV